MYMFRPSDSELLTFLLRFIAKEALHDDGFITVCNVYNQDPWETYNCYGRHCGGRQNYGYRYFVTPIKKKKKRGGRLIISSRSVGDNIGIWKQNREVNISGDHNHRVHGRKKTLFYKINMFNPDDDEKWIMKEYVLSEDVLRKLDKSEYKDYVICAIKKKPKKVSRVFFKEAKKIVESLMMTENISEYSDSEIMDLLIENIEMEKKVIEEDQESGLVAGLVEAMTELELPQESNLVDGLVDSMLELQLPSMDTSTY